MTTMTLRPERLSGGRLRPWLALYVLCPLLFVCFFGFAALAASAFPTPYDFRYRWVSSLASARDNPFGHHYFGMGLIGVSALLAPLSWYLFHHVGGHELLRRTGLLLLLVGTGGLLMLGVEATFFATPGPARAIHGASTVMFFGGITLGLMCFGFLAFRNAALPDSMRRGYAYVTCGLLLLPTVAALLCNLVWYITQGDPRLFGSEWPERVAPVAAASLAFWEWLAIVGLVLVMHLTVWMVSQTRE